MPPVYLATLIHTATHAAFSGSKIIVSLLALELGATPLVVGALVACYAVAPLALGVFTGRLADSIGMRAPMLAGAGFIGAAMLVGGLWQALPALLAVALLVGTGFAFFIVSVQNLIGVLPGNRARNYSVLAVGYSASNFIAPLVAGFTIEHAGHATAFFVFAGFTALPLAVLIARPALTRVDVPKSPPGPRHTLDLLRNAPLRAQIVITGLLMSAWELYLFYVPVYGHTIGLSPSTIGIILGVFSVATFLVRFGMSAITARATPQQVLAFSMLLAACASAVFPLLGAVPALVAASFVLGLGIGCGQPLSMTLSFERSPPGRSGEVAGLRLVATNLARFVVPLGSGVLGTVLGAGSVFWLNALTLAVISRMARRAS